MPSLKITPSKLSGTLHIPPSKSHTLRALLFASLAQAPCTLNNLLPSPDTIAMRNALQALQQPGTPIDCGNSGLVLRFITALASLRPHRTPFTGDSSIQTRRPMQPLYSALNQLGAHTSHLLIQGPIHPGTATLDGADSQPVSALLIACSLLPGPTTLHVTNPGELPWIDLTLSWFDRLGISYQRNGYTTYQLPGHAQIAPFSYTVPGDYSTALFPLAASLITHSSITITGLNPTDPQGDRAIFQHLPTFQGGVLDVNPFIDAVPILAALACYLPRPTTLTNCSIARHKESDRLAAITAELTKMGARITESPDSLHIIPTPLHGAELHSHFDHRIALALAVAALGASTPSIIHNTQCIAKTYPTFVEDFQRLGAHIEPHPLWI